MRTIFTSRNFALGIVCITALSTSCSSDGSIQGDSEVHTNFPQLVEFPDTLFCGLYWNQPLEESRKNLLQRGFQLTDSSGVWRYWSQMDSTEMILPATSELTSFKVFMRSAQALKNGQELTDLLQAHSQSVVKGQDFTVFSYQTTQHEFKVSKFVQSEFIRLTYELKLSK